MEIKGVEQDFVSRTTSIVCLLAREGPIAHGTAVLLDECIKSRALDFALV
jgi:hypothetical protein